MQAELTQLRADNTKLNVALDYTVQAETDESAAVSKLSAEKAQLLDKLKKVKPALQRAQATKLELQQTESIMHEVQAELQRVRSELQDREAEFEQRGQALQTARSSAIALQKELAAAQSATTATSEVASEARMAAEQRAAEMQKVVDRLHQEAKDAASAHADTVKSAAADAEAKLQAAAAAAREEGAKLQDAIAAAESRTAEARREAAAAQAQLLAQQAAAGSSEATASQVQEQLHAAKQEAHTAKSTVVKQQRVLRQLKAALRAHTGAPAWYAPMAAVTLPHVHVTTSSPSTGSTQSPPLSPGASDTAPVVPPPSSLHAHMEVQGGGDTWHLVVLPKPPKSAADMRSADSSTCLQWVSAEQLQQWHEADAPSTRLQGQCLRCTSDAPPAASTGATFNPPAMSIAYMQEHGASPASSAADSASAALAARFGALRAEATAAAAAAAKREQVAAQRLEAATTSLAEYKAKAQAAMRRGGGADSAARRLEGQMQDLVEQLQEAKQSRDQLQLEFDAVQQLLDTQALHGSAPRSPSVAAGTDSSTRAAQALEEEVTQLQDALASSKAEQRRLQSMCKGHAKALREAAAAAAAQATQLAQQQAESTHAELSDVTTQLQRSEAMLRTVKSTVVEQSAEVDALRLQLAAMSRRHTAPLADPELQQTAPKPSQDSPQHTAAQLHGGAQSSAAALEAAVGAALASGAHAGDDGSPRSPGDEGDNYSAAMQNMQTQVLEVQGQLADSRDEAATYRQQLQRQVAELAQLRAAVHDMRTAAAREEELLGPRGKEEDTQGAPAAAVPGSPSSVASSARRGQAGGSAGSSTQLVYLKNALVSWATARDVGDKRRMLPALCTLLKLSQQDQQRIHQALQDEASVSHGLQSAGMGLLSSVFG